jgi:hypothetical protein
LARTLLTVRRNFCQYQQPKRVILLNSTLNERFPFQDDYTTYIHPAKTDLQFTLLDSPVTLIITHLDNADRPALKHATVSIGMQLVNAETSESSRPYSPDFGESEHMPS